MPRTTLNSQKYRLKDFSEWVIGKMRMQNVRQIDLAREIGISQPTFSAKLKKCQFCHEDMLILFKKLGATDEDILRLMKY